MMTTLLVIYLFMACVEGYFAQPFIEQQCTGGVFHRVVATVMAGASAPLTLMLFTRTEFLIRWFDRRWFDRR